MLRGHSVPRAVIGWVVHYSRCGPLGRVGLTAEVRAGEGVEAPDGSVRRMVGHAAARRHHSGERVAREGGASCAHRLAIAEERDDRQQRHLSERGQDEEGSAEARFSNEMAGHQREQQQQRGLDGKHHAEEERGEHRQVGFEKGETQHGEQREERLAHGAPIHRGGQLVVGESLHYDEHHKSDEEVALPRRGRAAHVEAQREQKGESLGEGGLLDAREGRRVGCSECSVRACAGYEANISRGMVLLSEVHKE